MLLATHFTVIRQLSNHTLCLVMTFAIVGGLHPLQLIPFRCKTIIVYENVVNQILYNLLSCMPFFTSLGLSACLVEQSTPLHGCSSWIVCHRDFTWYEIPHALSHLTNQQIKNYWRPPDHLIGVWGYCDCACPGLSILSNHCPVIWQCCPKNNA